MRIGLRGKPRAARTTVLGIALLLAFAMVSASDPRADETSPSNPEAPAAQSTAEEVAAQRAADEASELENPDAVVPVPEPTPRALQRHAGNNLLWAVGMLWGLIVPALVLLTGLSARMRNVAVRIVGSVWGFIANTLGAVAGSSATMRRRIERLRASRLLTIPVYFGLFLLVTYVLNFPLSYYQDFVREHAYGLSNQTFGKWFADSLKVTMVAWVFGSMTLWLPYLLLRKSPRRWWFYTGLGLIPFFFFFAFIFPVFVDPLFNDFGPMKDKVLESRILALADKAGIEGSRVYEVAKSVDTKTLNAYVTGLLATKRIVLWDTTLAAMTPEEVLFVMGHEMGHYVLGHVWKSFLFLSVFVMMLLYGAHRLSGAILRRFGSRMGFDRLGDIESLPLIVLLTTIIVLIAIPVPNAYSRWQEHEADRFGLEITQNSHAAGKAFVKLMENGIGIPRPRRWVVLWRAEHPTIGDRIDFCNAYKPWTTGAPLRYGSHFVTAPGAPSAAPPAAQPAP